MRKLISLLFVVLTLSILLSSCSKGSTENTVNVWDGTIANSFGGGDGSEGAPYEIHTASQLAYLSEQVGLGETYTGKFFTLERDLDLNDIEWTPIGNGIHSFEGVFDGGGHNILNLKVSGVVKYEKILSHGTFKYGAAGLFATCKNSVITDLTIRNACISAKSSQEYDAELGVLTGAIYVDSYCEISNVKLEECKVLLGESEQKGFLQAGGIAGDIRTSEGASFVMDKIQADANFLCKDLSAKESNIGVISGNASLSGNLEISNVSAHVTLDAPLISIEKITVGTFGYYYQRMGNSRIKDSFITLKVNNVADKPYGFYTIEFKSMVGLIPNATASSGTYKDENISLEVNDLYEFFRIIDNKNENTVVIPEYENLYEINSPNAVTLPEDHGFDTDIWDVSDPSNPVLK